MTLPNFYLIGAAKSGTTALTTVLSRHPQFSLPEKEPGFASGWDPKDFAGPQARYARQRRLEYHTLEAYLRLYEKSGGAKVICDASTGSLTSETAAQVIRGLAPGARIMAILRQPVDRAFSHFNSNRATGIEPEADFLAYVRTEPDRIRDHWHPHSCYLQTSHYPVQLQRYFECFDREQMLLAIYEDWADHGDAFLRKVLGFVELDYTPRMERIARVNVTALPKDRWQATSGIRHVLKLAVPQPLRRALLARIRPIVSVRPRLDPQVRRELTARYFREDIQKLETILQRDLSHWLE
jgi:hypothetical protein